MIADCEHCGNPFDQSRAWHKYCSSECRYDENHRALWEFLHEYAEANPDGFDKWDCIEAAMNAGVGLSQHEFGFTKGAHNRNYPDSPPIQYDRITRLYGFPTSYVQAHDNMRQRMRRAKLTATALDRELEALTRQFPQSANIFALWKRSTDTIIGFLEASLQQ